MPPRRRSRTTATQQEEPSPPKSPTPPLPSSEDDASSDASSSDHDEPIIPLLAGREKRFNAGSRMRALLEDEAEAAAQFMSVEGDAEMFKEEENDEEFETKEEKDEFDSDFGSTDSGSGAEDQDDEEAGEKTLQREQRQAKKDARGKKKKVVHTPFLPSFARQTKHAAKQQQQAIASTSASTLDENGVGGDEGEGGSPQPTKRRRKMTAIEQAAFMIPQRESSRKSAVAFKKSIEGRLKESEQRRASLPKPTKKALISLTQADLIAEALSTEEINRASLLAFYAAEEDRRAQDRIAGMRYEIWGPRISFLSRVEGVKEGERWRMGGGGEGVGEGEEGEGDKKGKGKGKEVESGEKMKGMESGRRRLIEVIGEAGKVGWEPGEKEKGLVVVATGEEEEEEEENGSASTSTSILAPTTTITDVPLTLSRSYPPPPPPVSSTTTTLQSKSGSYDPSQPPHTRNYVILEEVVGGYPDEMDALFGDHHDWGTVKIVSDQDRVEHRQPPTCPLSGLPARYLDPLTLVPFGSMAAFKKLREVHSHQYEFNTDVGEGAYTVDMRLGVGKEVEKSRKRREKKKGSTATGVVASKAVDGGGGGGAEVVEEPTVVVVKEKVVKKEKEKEVIVPKEKEVVENPYGRSYATAGGARKRGRGVEEEVVGTVEGV